MQNMAGINAPPGLIQPYNQNAEPFVDAPIAPGPAGYGMYPIAGAPSNPEPQMEMPGLVMAPSMEQPPFAGAPNDPEPQM